MPVIPKHQTLVDDAKEVRNACNADATFVALSGTYCSASIPTPTRFRASLTTAPAEGASRSMFTGSPAPAL